MVVAMVVPIVMTPMVTPMMTTEVSPPTAVPTPKMRLAPLRIHLRRYHRLGLGRAWFRGRLRRPRLGHSGQREKPDKRHQSQKKLLHRTFLLVFIKIKHQSDERVAHALRGKP